ncbi:MAG: fluoride efflux transporter CrcB [Betaproteobacteria bacterium]|nr:fluoride efflux transporter CrcB [Betaproteobacteria bacterium]
MNLQTLLAVAIGGAAGSVARFVVGVWSTRALGDGFPWGTLFINVSGSFLIGLFVELFALHWDAPQPMRVFLAVGICGGYTTFSTFSLDTYVLIERGQYGFAATYVAASVIGSIAALVGALHLLRAV